MFAELFFVLLLIFVLLLVDNWSTLLGLILCVLFVYCYVYNFSYVFNKRSVTLVISNVWAGLVFCFETGNRIFQLFQRIYSSRSRKAELLDLSFQFCGNKATFENEINVLVSKISQNYINSWYDKVSENQEFTSLLNHSINDSFIHLCASISKTDKRKISIVVLQIYLNFFSHFIEAKKKSQCFKKENFKMKHWAMKGALSEWCYLQSLVSNLLDAFCPSERERSLHSKQSPLLHTLVVEILTENIMHPLVSLLSDPSRLNILLLKLLLNFFDVAAEKNKLVIKMYPHKDNISSMTSVNRDPIILLPTEELQDEVFEESLISTSSNSLILSDNNCMIKSDLLEPFVQNSKPNDFTSLVSSSMKSSSNINLSDCDFSNLQVPNLNSSPLMCDTTIKRSRSADYIRQMPKLKALNEKHYNILQKERNRMFVSLKSEINSSICIEQAEEAMEIEIPTLFTGIKIIATFQENEASRPPYTLYCIQYTGVFHDTGKSTDAPHFVKQTINVKRRFREFVLLHSRLEDNPSLKIYLKGIKGPSKWPSLPFSNLDKNIADRKIFLENYLKELCCLAPIAHSIELQEFLAYGGDEKISYLRKVADASVPRIDKMLVRGVKGAFDIIKTALPNSPLEEETSPKVIFEDKIFDHKFQEHLLNYSSREPEIKEYVTNFIETSCKLNSDDWDPYDFNHKKTSLLRNTNFKPVKSCDCSVLNESQYDKEEYPFGNAIMELIAIAFDIDDNNSNDILCTLKILFSACINRFCVNKIDTFSDEHMVTLLHLLHKLLWTQESSASEQVTNIEGDIPDIIMQYVEDILFEQDIFQNIAFAVKPVLVKKIGLILSSIQHQDVNRCLLFHIFDAVNELLCSKEAETLL